MWKKFISGIDAGSATTKAIIINQEKEILSYTIIPTSFDFRKAAETAYKKAIFEAKISEKEIKKIIATGYGRNSIDFATRTVSEITAHAKGVKHLIPSAHTIIDIGGQDSKVISISDSGKVIDFLMNDRCAAGTGKFLEITSRALEIPIHQIGKLCLKSVNPVNISSMCTVFAESEVISLRAQGFDKADIASGLHNSIAQRIVSMVSRLGVKPDLPKKAEWSALVDIAFVGGVAKNRCMQKELEKLLKTKLMVPEEPQITGALGAALIASEEDG